jgi:uncharacterized protein (DUF2236 family)
VKPEGLNGNDRIPDEVRDTLCGLALAAAGANVIMQLARLPVGHGVAHSTVDSGRVDKHPLKRLRTTSSYLAVSMLGSEDDRLAMRREVNRAHTTVRSAPPDPVQYNAFDPQLQLWVAACLYKGTEDVYRLVAPEPSEGSLDALYRHCRRFGTTLQVPEEDWPADRDAFESYWVASMAEIEMDDVTRPYLQGIANLDFLRPPLGVLASPVVRTFGPLNRLLTLGFLHPPFRDELGLPWDDRRQRAFDALTGASAAVTRRLPGPLRAFPFNVYLEDVRRRVRAGRPIV